MKIIRTTIASFAFMLGCMILGYFLAIKSKYESEGAIWQAYHQREASRWSALKAMAEVEAKRTDVERANQKVAFAESRLQRACSKLKGRC